MLKIAVVSSTRGYVGGNDRDWVNIANALGPERLRLVWVGISGTRAIAEVMRPGLLIDCIDEPFPIFDYVIQGAQDTRRNPWLWAKIVADHVLRLVAPVRALTRRLSLYDLDVVVSNAGVILAGALAAKRLAVPHLWCVKEWLDPTGRPERALAKVIELLGDKIVVPSRSIAGVFSGPVSVIPDGTDIAGTRLAGRSVSRSEILASYGLAPMLPVMAQVGTLSRWKGQHVTLAALRELANRHVSPIVSTIFLGRGTEGWCERLRQATAELPPLWRSQVVFAEFRSGDLAPLAAADFVAHPSIYPDPYPNAVREAMILGKPVIGSAAGGVADMVLHGETGLLFPPGDSAALARAIESLALGEKQRTMLGIRAASHAEREFDVGRRKDAMWTALETLAKRPRPSESVKS